MLVSVRDGGARTNVNNGNTFMSANERATIKIDGSPETAGVNNARPINANIVPPYE